MSDQLRAILTDPVAFSTLTLPRFAARQYQQPPMRAVWQSVTERAGRSFAVAFSRQAGKDETIAQLVLAIMSAHRIKGGTVIIAAPTDDQAAITLERLWSRAKASAATRAQAKKSGDSVTIGNARCHILSADPSANVRGHTASLLLIANEAQDISPAIWDARFAPMGASTNATTLFSGTVWDRSGLLARELEHLTAIQTPEDPRVFLVPWRVVAGENPAYGKYVETRIAQLGQDHPYIKTEYELQPLDAGSPLFGSGILAQLQGSHERLTRGTKGRKYALLIDVAGEEESDPGSEAFDTSSKRDSTAATIVELTSIDSSTRPAYRVVDRRLWTGVRHTTLHQVLHDLASNVWGASFVAIDATGIGAGLASMLAASLPRQRVQVIPYVWSSSNKSQAGWDLISLIATGRLKEYERDSDHLTAEFWRQMELVQYATSTGPGHRIRWGVPSNQGHDDLVLSLALLALLDLEDLRPRHARGM